MKIVTGYVGEKHITSNDDQGLLQGIFGTGNYILPVRGRFAATLVSSNELQISDGEGVLQGVHFRVEPGTSDSVTIENGVQGMQRIDLICARYEKDTESGVESMSWINHKGTAAASNPAQPSYTAGDLLAGDTLAEFPVYAVRLNGITVQSVTQLATILSPQALIGDSSISGIGDGTITGALSALNASLSDINTNLAKPLAIYRNSNNATSFTFPCIRKERGSYSYFLMIGGAGAQAAFVWHGFVSVESTGNVVVLKKIGGDSVITFTATYNGADTLTINASATCYGGIRLIWLS